MSLWLIPPLIVVAVARAYKKTATARAIAAYGARHPVNDDGVALGAETIVHRGSNGRALLLLHGSGDTPQTLHYLARRLNEAGYTVRAPLLPGHGRSPAAFATVSAEQYLAAVRGELDVLRREAGWIGVVGLSMGGALGAQLAAEASDIRALVLLAPYLLPPRSVAAIAASSWVWGAVVPFVGGRGQSSVHDAVAGRESRAYGIFSPRALRALVATAAAGRRALPGIGVPTLVVNSREDNRIPVALAELAVQSLRAPTEQHWVSGCGHVITVDYCKDTVAALVLDFLSRQPR